MQLPPITTDVERYDGEWFIRFACDLFELSVAVPDSSVDQLQRVPITGWLAGALRFGKSAGSPVFWSCDDEVVSLHIGQDDQTWEIGIRITLETFSDALKKIIVLREFEK